MFSNNFGNELSAHLHKSLGGMDCYIDEWVELLKKGDHTKKTIHMKKTTVTKFCSHFKSAETVKKVSVQEWINGLILNDVATATIRRSLSEIRGYWGYLKSKGIVEDENSPFEKLSLGRKAGANRKAFAPEDITKLIAAAEDEDDGKLADMIRIAAFTGARIEEIAILRAQDVLAGEVIIHGTKTASAARKMPVHADLAPTLERLCSGSKDEWLFALMEDSFGDRSNGVGKRFGRLKTDIGFGPDLTFHSLRKTWGTMLWSAGVQRELISQMIGHSTGHLTTDVYARDPDFETKKSAIALIKYPGYVGR